MDMAEDPVVDQMISLLADAGHHVAVFQRHNDGIVSMPLLSKALVAFQVPWNVRARAEITTRLHAERPDIVHIQNTFPLLSSSVLMACAEFGVPTVATLHGYLMTRPSSNPLLRRQRVRRLHLRASATRASPRVLPWLTYRQRAAHGQLGRQPPVLVVDRGALSMHLRSAVQGLHPGGHAGAAVGRQARLRRRFGRPRSGEHVLYLGRLSEEKDRHLLTYLPSHLSIVRSSSLCTTG